MAIALLHPSAEHRQTAARASSFDLRKITSENAAKLFQFELN
jgi:hypothetical protein